jgi:hypothetical protein
MRNASRMFALFASGLLFGGCETGSVNSASTNHQPPIRYTQPLMVVSTVLSPNPLVMSANEVQGIVDVYFNHPTTDSGSVSVRVRIPDRPWDDTVGDQRYAAGEVTVRVPIRFQLNTPATIPMNVHIFASSQKDYPGSLSIVKGH